MKKLVILLSLSVIIMQLSFAPIGSAKMYTWVDRNGVTRRTYYPPPEDQAGSAQNVGKVPASSQQVQDNKVELYITSWCPYCRQAEEFFSSRGIKVTVYDIEKDGNAAKRKKKLDKDGGGVPFAVVNGENISGYAPEQYDRALR